MIGRMKRGIAALLALVLTLLVPFTGMTVSASEQSQGDTAANKATIWVVGDSTVSPFTDNYYYPRYGWGTQLDKFFDSSKFEVKNLALSGRSSKSYTEDKEYQTLLAGMKQGDFLFIGFGHNDEKAEEARFTDPNGTYETEGSFANSLYVNYIKPAREAGCSPVLMTPIVRRTEDTFSNSQLHITTTSYDTNGKEYKGGDYPQAIRDLGKTLDIPVVDMTAMTKEVYESLGAAGTRYLHAWTSNKENSVDNTHTNIWGATYNGYLIAKTIKELGVAGLTDAVVESMIAAAPAKEVYLKSNPDYVVPEYSNDLKNSELWSDYGIWKGTAFGDIGGGAPTTDNFTVGTDTKGDMNIAVRNNKGKISGNTDGIAMYYYKVPVGKKFTLTATATVNELDIANDQVSFGLMARDDMYIDVYNNATLGDYVAAGPLKMKTGKWSCFARKSGTLTQGGTLTNAIELNKPIELKIESNSDGYACTFGNEQTITGGFDFPLNKIDSEYVYVGMFASRKADITYTNIKLVIDGKEVTATPEVVPTTEPTVEPTVAPTTEPTVEPTVAPTTEPTVAPTTEPTVAPTVAPTTKPTTKPAEQSVKVGTVKKVTVTAKTTDSVKISWKKATNATRYQVQMYNGKKWITVKTTKETSVKVSKLSSGTNYTFRVRGYATVSGKTVYGSYSEKLYTATLTKAPKISVKSGKRKATVTLGKVTGASGYEVYVSTKKSSGFKKATTMKKSKPVSYTAKGLKKGKAYYFKARSYKVVNGKKVYSQYSTVKKVVVK